MAKLPAKKPKLTPEEQLAELAALTGDVAAINLMHTNAPAATPAPSAVAATSPSPPETVAPAAVPHIAAPAQAEPAANSAPAAVAESVSGEPSAADRGGEEQPKGMNEPASTPAPTPQPAAATVAAPVAAAVAAPTVNSTEEEDALLTETAEPVVATVAQTAGTAYSLDALFEPSKEKKTVMMRITPALHQYFQQVGLLLGDGASVPDVVHNILLEWKALHGPEVQKALQKQMRLMLKNAS